MKWRGSGRTGRMKIKIKNPFSRKKSKVERSNDNEYVIEQDTSQINLLISERPSERNTDLLSGKKNRHRSLFRRDKIKTSKPQKTGKTKNEQDLIKSRNAIERIAFNLFSTRLSTLVGFKTSYDQSGSPVVFEAYVSTGIVLSLLASIPVFVFSLLLELKLLPDVTLLQSLIGSVCFSVLISGTVIGVWLFYPVMRRKSLKSKLENQLAYSFGILGVLAAGGMNLERLFERIATADSNPVLADLARRFLRNMRIFGLDTEAALAEVAEHSPSDAFSKMLESIGVAHKTTGSIHDLVMFESSRLLQEKRDKLRKTIGSLAVMAELYITLVVVGPIIFIVMLAIFALLPNSKKLPAPISLINLVVFIGVPVLSVMFVLMLDSVVSKA
jgi:hypothetical protein